MDYQKIINLFDDATSQPSKFETINQVDTNYELRKTYNISNQMKVIK